MIRGLTAVVLLAVLAGPCLCQGPVQGPPPPEVAALQAQLWKMKGKIKQMRRDITALQEGKGMRQGMLTGAPPDLNARLGELEARLNQLGEGFLHFTKAPPDSWRVATQAQLMDISNRLAAIEQRLAGAPPGAAPPADGSRPNPEFLQILDTLRAMKAENDARFGSIERRLSALETPPLKPTTVEARYGTPTGTGSVLLTNATNQAATVYVRGVSYSVLPFGQRRIDGVPAGDLNYRVVLAGFGEVPIGSTCPLVAGQIKQITINP
jgi:hypothetical protein